LKKFIFSNLKEKSTKEYTQEQVFQVDLNLFYLYSCVCVCLCVFITQQYIMIIHEVWTAHVLNNMFVWVFAALASKGSGQIKTYKIGLTKYSIKKIEI